MSLDDDIDAIAPEPDWLRGIGEASTRRGTDTLTMRDVNVEIAAARRQTATRIRDKGPPPAKKK